MISTMVIDDEEMAVKQLEFLLGQYPELQLCAAVTDPVEALEKAALCQPELVFLDIHMPEVSGLEVAEELMCLLPQTYIVFVTAYDEYALQAFEYNAIDYVLKPVTRKRLEKTMQKVLLNLQGAPKKKNGGGAQLAKLRNLRKEGSVKIIAVEEEGRILLLQYADVIMFTPQGHGALIHTKDKVYRTRQSMQYWEERLEEFNFFRCHKSYLVNFNRIEKLLPMFNNTYLLKLADYPKEIPVSRSKAKELSQILGL